ncbi:MAG: hypothetical protein JW913_02935 [Chitinispirillaceae bacterium]|nr:hypothetical protein [Chitinispirillaceae bacterium]
MQRFRRLILIWCLFFPLFAVETITDEQLGYSIFLPDNWVREIASPTHHRFIDTSGTYQSMVVIDRHDFSSETIYMESTEWTRANFIAYELSIEADPLCALVFYDTVTVKQNDTFWAAEAYTYYFDIDSTIGEWAEYIRFTAVGRCGFELYAIGPTADLDSNIGYYAAIIDGIILQETNDPVIQPPTLRRHVVYSASASPSSPSYRLNLLGQRFGGRLNGIHASQISVMPRRRACLIKITGR